MQQLQTENFPSMSNFYSQLRSIDEKADTRISNTENQVSHLNENMEEKIHNEVQLMKPNLHN